MCVYLILSLNESYSIVHDPHVATERKISELEDDPLHGQLIHQISACSDTQTTRERTMNTELQLLFLF